MTFQPSASPSRAAWLRLLFGAGLLLPALIPSVAAQQSQPAQATSPASAQPDFGPQVLILDPADKDAQARVDAVFKQQEAAQFGNGRYAILLKPGTHRLDLRVGFATQVGGLGRNPEDVEVKGSVRSTAEWMEHNNATCNFWRGLENLSVTPTRDHNTLVWAVSQGTYLRRLHVRGKITFSEKGWSSGGFMADSVIDQAVDTGTQQQWFTRNSRFKSWGGHGWNMVFVGCPDAGAGSWPKPPYTSIAQAPLTRERPYLHVDEKGEFRVLVPDLRLEPASGPSWQDNKVGARSLPLSDFHLAQPGRDTAATLNRALAAGKHLLFCPGIYELDDSLRVPNDNTLVLGLGYPTLVPTTGKSALEVDASEGVILAGFMVDAGPNSSATLVRVGIPGRHAGNPRNPTVLNDVFCRVGGAIVGKAETMLEIHSDHVIGDNLWLWRADHGAGAKWEINTNKTGLRVEGNHVTTYGLMVEHTQEFQTLWNGEDGRCYFYQSELPYDPPSTAAWSHDGIEGYASYKVGDHVQRHQAWGLGVYAVFFAAPVMTENALEAPDRPGVQLRHMCTLWLNGKKGSGIRHVLSGKGESAVHNNRHVTME